MSLLFGITLAASGFLLAAVFGYGLVTAWRRAMHDDGPLPLFGMIKRRRLTPEGLETVANAEILAPAVRRCTFCGSKEQCRTWLASGQQGGYPAFCANSGLFEQESGQ